MALQLNTEKVLEIFKETAAETAARLNRVHEALWTARLDAVRSIIAVATAVLAGLVVFLENLLADLTWIQRILLLASWVLLLGSIGFGLAVSWLSITLRTFHPALFNSQPEVEKECAKLDPAAPDLREQITGIIKVVVDRVTAPIGTADARANRAAHLCLTLFLLSLLCLVAFAAARVLCGDT
jgi:hypothetical protein